MLADIVFSLTDRDLCISVLCRTSLHAQYEIDKTTTVPSSVWHLMQVDRSDESMIVGPYR